MTYLKKIEYEAINVIAFNEKTLSSIDVFRDESINIYKYENLKDFEDSINYWLDRGFSITTRKEFNENYIKFSTNLNQIVKEL